MPRHHPLITPQDAEAFIYVVKARPGHEHQHTVRDTRWKLAENSRPALQRLAKELKVKYSSKMRKADLVHALLPLDSRFQVVGQAKRHVSVKQ